MEIHKRIPELLAPGYLFFAPWNTDDLDVGPYIYDTQGHLIWSGASTIYGELVMNFHQCNFKSKPHICLFEGRSKETWGQGRGVILDSEYQVVATTETGAGASLIDMHEFQLINDGRSALVNSYEIKPFDGIPLNMVRGFSWLLDSRFREIDMRSGEVKFSWSAEDHIDPCTSLEEIVAPIGMTRLTPYDFFHLNSATKSERGDYIISARHMDAIYKISGEDGRILWKLGGPDSDFRVDFDMCRQHHVRIQEESGNKTVLSIFNNGCKANRMNSSASGMLVELDEGGMSARLLQAFNPENELEVDSQGSVEMLKSGNALVGWGKASTITEHTADGTIIFNATLGGGVAQTYRAHKADWHGFPTDQPRVFSYSKTLEASTVIYVSWNGATEVVIWRFYGRNAANDSFELLGSTEKDGFETTFVTTCSYRFVIAEAVSKEGESLRNSSIEQTFIPSQELSEYCTEMLCPMHSLDVTVATQRDEAVAGGRSRSGRLFPWAFRLNWVELLVLFSCATVVVSVVLQRRNLPPPKQ